MKGKKTKRKAIISQKNKNKTPSAQDGSDAATHGQLNTPAPPRSESSIRSEISLIFSECAEQIPDVSEAATRAIEIIRDRQLPVMLVESIVHDYASIRIHQKRSQVRVTLRKAADGDEASIARALAGRRTWLDSYMVGGKPLRECNRDDLLLAAKNLERTIDGFKHAATFYRKLAEKIGDSTVGATMTETEIANLDRSV